MSCIAGVGGDVKPLVRTAKSGRPLIAIDGCPLRCAAHILKRHGLKAERHYDLSTMGVKKKYHEDFDPEEAARMLDRILKDSGPGVRRPASRATRVAGEAREPPAETGSTAPAPPPVPSGATEGEASAPASSPCFLGEFKDW